MFYESWRNFFGFCFLLHSRNLVKNLYFLDELLWQREYIYIYITHVGLHIYLSFLQTAVVRQWTFLMSEFIFSLQKIKKGKIIKCKRFIFFFSWQVMNGSRPPFDSPLLQVFLLLSVDQVVSYPDKKEINRNDRTLFFITSPTHLEMSKIKNQMFY
jgi:hypothetical protein